MDLEALKRAANLFAGEHDFLSFAATDPDLAGRGVLDISETAPAGPSPAIPATVRTIFSSVWERQQSQAGELLVYRVRGNGFLHHMVRNLVGTMLDVGRGRLGVEAIPAILSARSRAAAGPTASARGLFLLSVEYGREK
jgi:tRNA pseudouridine38-40 synthase